VPDTPSVILVKRFPYRGVNEEWSNKYHFSGSTPGDAAAWKILIDAIYASEKTCLLPEVVLVRGYGYEAGSDHANAVVDYTISPLAVVPGTLSASGDPQAPGDAAAVLRWSTPNFSHGKRIYLRKYFHGAATNGNLAQDEVLITMKTAMLAHGAKMIDGTLPGAARVCGPQGAVASSPTVLPFLTYRRLKRRARRNPTP
jgi:hypothetical protein